jgi:Tol biopolymer transport system component
VVNVDSTGLKRVGEFDHHPLWHPNRREVLANSRWGDRDWLNLVLTDVDTGVQRLVMERITGTGHPSFASDGNRITVEYVLDREGYGSIHVVDVEKDRIEHVAQVRVINHTHTGTHLHPAWSRDGRQILYASDASGSAQLCAIDV